MGLYSGRVFFHVTEPLDEYGIFWMGSAITWSIRKQANPV